MFVRLCVLVANLSSGGVDGLVGVSTDGVHKLSIDEDLVRELNLSVVGLDHCLQGNRDMGCLDTRGKRDMGCLYTRGKRDMGCLDTRGKREVHVEDKCVV